MTAKEALEIVENPSTTPTYRAACRFLCKNRSLFDRPIFIYLPANHTASEWRYTKQHSKAECACGTERVIFPKKQRTSFDPGEIMVTAMLHPETRGVFLAPKGGNSISAYIRLFILGEDLLYTHDPFRTECSGEVRGWALKDLAHALKTSADKQGAMFSHIFAITHIDLTQRTAAIRLDKDVETHEINGMPVPHCGGSTN